MLTIRLHGKKRIVKGECNRPAGGIGSGPVVGEPLGPGPIVLFEPPPPVVFYFD